MGTAPANGSESGSPPGEGTKLTFPRVEKSLSEDGSVEGLDVNGRTASVLIKGSPIDMDHIIALGEKYALFQLEEAPPKVEPLSSRIATPFRDLGRSIDRFSGGEIDLAGMAFLGLIAWGMVQLARGNLTAPPWYVAFWYALGIFTKSLMDKPS